MCVTDRQTETDGQTPHDGKERVMLHAKRRTRAGKTSPMTTRYVTFHVVVTIHIL